MLLDNDDVLLLTPSDADSGLVDLMVTRAPNDETPNEATSTGEVVVFILDASGAANFSHHFGHQIATELTAGGADLVATFITEDSPNTFTRLPVRESEQVFVTFARSADGLVHEAHKPGTEAHWSKEAPATGPRSVVSLQRLRLSPTPRSALR